MSRSSQVWSNGELIPFVEAKVHMLSHGFSRGSAVFEVFGVHLSPNGPQAFRMDEHLKRLVRTCDLLGMHLAHSPSEIAEAVKQTVTANTMANGYIKVMAYYSEISLGNLVPEGNLDLAIFALEAGSDLGLDSNKTVSACISKWCKLHPRSVPPMAKACANYLNGFLARQDARQRGYDIGILLDTHGFVGEGAMESVFIVKEGVLKTPPLGRVLSSITRMSIIELARVSDMKVLETPILPDELSSADEIFFSATPFKVLPVNRLDNVQFDAPGPISIRLAELMSDVTTCKDDRFTNWFQPL
ncbi:MAG: aminotransferase class IV [Deltaproteobacteria bacterium]|nr:aminotransferase class IV [Deltaproteobacteria bacterium]